MKLLDFINNHQSDATPTLGGISAEVVINPEGLERSVAAGEQLAMVVVHSVSDASRMRFDVGSHGVLRLVEIFLGGSFVECDIKQQTDSQCDITLIQVAGAIADYTINLDGSHASNRVRAAYVVGDEERCRVSLRVNHNVADCTSDSLVKGVAGGKAVGEFNGMVYVAQDAQRTDARQTNRNVEIGSDAKIITKPQLEIYADDVKCSHGATVGQMDGDAILYMRQRGLSEQQARRMQLEGFVADVVAIDGELGEALREELVQKLEKL